MAASAPPSNSRPSRTRAPKPHASRGSRFFTVTSLPHFLQGVSGLPTQIVWGRDDALVPVSAAQAYQQALKNTETRLTIFDDCGHRPEIEKSAEFIKLVNEFLA